MSPTNKLVLALACAALAGPASATNGMRMTGFGPVQNSMGGVGVGATLDAASVVTNPAGMTELDGRIDFGATYFRPSPEYSATGLSGSGIPAGMFVLADGKTLTSARPASPIPVLGIVVPLDQRWSFGLGAYGVAGMGVDYAQNLYGSTTYTSYSQMRFTPGVAYKLSDLVSLGVTLNGMWATMEWNVAGAMGQAPHTTGSAFGIGGTIGVKVTPIPELTFGAAYETRSWFEDFAFVTPAGVDKVHFDQPEVVTLGVAGRPLPQLLLAADVEWIDWGQTNGTNLPEMHQNQSGAMPWNLGWSGQLVLKLGAEVAPASWLRLRAGYNYGKAPLDAARAFENIAFPAVAEHHVMGGVGLKVTEKLGVNVGFMIAPSASVAGENGGPPPAMGGTGQGLTSYQTSMSQWSLDAGIAYRY